MITSNVFMLSCYRYDSSALTQSVRVEKDIILVVQENAWTLYREANSPSLYTKTVQLNTISVQ